MSRRRLLLLLQVLIVPNVVDVPIHFAMVATAFFAIIAGAHKSLGQASESQRTGESKVRAPPSAAARTAARR